mmetsp:Transcript_14592/g.43150  ORF Transcript_14592/g.43150 Transcript_14592/m.43150 type:complete len:105 (+) Transcript_14592:2271-2585(+)
MPAAVWCIQQQRRRRQRQRRWKYVHSGQEFGEQTKAWIRFRRLRRRWNHKKVMMVLIFLYWQAGGCVHFVVGGRPLHLASLLVLSVPFSLSLSLPSRPAQPQGR